MANVLVLLSCLLPQGFGDDVVLTTAFPKRELAAADESCHSETLVALGLAPSARLVATDLATLAAENVTLLYLSVSVYLLCVCLSVSHPVVLNSECCQYRGGSYDELRTRRSMLMSRVRSPYLCALTSMNVECAHDSRVFGFELVEKFTCSVCVGRGA